jgi:hypothetical protein
VKQRPRMLVYLATFLCLVAVSFPVQIMILYGHSPSEGGAIAAKLAPLNWAVIVFAPLTAWLAFRASAWLMAALPVLVAVVIYNNWLVGQIGADYSPLMTLLGSVAFIATIGATLTRDSLRVLLSPRSRWWLTPTRHKLELPVRLKFLSRAGLKKAPVSVDAYNEFYIRTYDLSEGGAEQEAKAFRAFQAILKNLAVGTQCYVCLPLKDVSFIQCRAEVVRNTNGRGAYPAGVGLRFLGLSWNERRRLQHYLDGAQQMLVKHGTGSGFEGSDDRAPGNSGSGPMSGAA